jgi:hypothetical protein
LRTHEIYTLFSFQRSRHTFGLSFII